MPPTRVFTRANVESSDAASSCSIVRPASLGSQQWKNEKPGRLEATAEKRFDPARPRRTILIKSLLYRLAMFLDAQASQPIAQSRHGNRVLAIGPGQHGRVGVPGVLSSIEKNANGNPKKQRTCYNAH